MNRRWFAASLVALVPAGLLRRWTASAEDKPDARSTAGKCCEANSAAQCGDCCECETAECEACCACC
jgi:hypothetical protein